VVCALHCKTSERNRNWKNAKGVSVTPLESGLGISTFK
jgi:hypothetical protein